MRLRTIIFILILIANPIKVHADNVTVTGMVRDSVTHEPIPFATVLLKGTDRGTLTDDNGKYTITTALRWDSIQAASCLLYTSEAADDANRV